MALIITKSHQINESKVSHYLSSPKSKAINLFYLLKIEVNKKSKQKQKQYQKIETFQYLIYKYL